MYADIDLAGVRFANPFIRGVRFSLATGLHVIAAHERRHLWQAWNVRRAEERARGRHTEDLMSRDEPDLILEFIRRMWAVDHELQRVSKRMVERIGLTAPQRLAVRFIGRHSGVTLGELAELLHLHAGTVTGIVRRLEELGFVVQTRSTEDTRRRHLTLTAKGRLDRPSPERHGGGGRTSHCVRGDLEDLATTAAVMDVLARNLAAE